MEEFENNLKNFYEPNQLHENRSFDNVINKADISNEAKAFESSDNSYYNRGKSHNQFYGSKNAKKSKDNSLENSKLSKEPQSEEDYSTLGINNVKAITGVLIRDFQATKVFYDYL